MDLILIAGALNLELKYLIRRLQRRKVIRSDRILCYGGFINSKKLIIVIAGMGKENAENAARFIETNFLNKDYLWNKQNLIEKIVIAGVSGALDKNLSIGDIIICKYIYSLYPGKKKITAYTNIPNMNTNMNRLNKFKIIKKDFNIVYHGNLLTVNNTITGRKQKESLSKKFNADAVDMESYWLLAHLLHEKVPVFCIRSVSDNMQYDISKLYENLMKNAFIDYSEVFLFMLKNPKEILKLIKSGINFRKACRNLNQFLITLLDSGD